MEKNNKRDYGWIKDTFGELVWDAVRIFWIAAIVSLLVGIGYKIGTHTCKPKTLPIKESTSLEEKVDQNAEDILGLKEHIVDLYHVECEKLRRELEFEE